MATKKSTAAAPIGSNVIWVDFRPRLTVSQWLRPADLNRLARKHGVDCRRLQAFLIASNPGTPEGRLLALAAA